MAGQQPKGENARRLKKSKQQTESSRGMTAFNPTYRYIAMP
jgi:hypothetical protein